MTKENYGDQRFTRVQADRILAEAAERQARDYETEPGEGLTYLQIVESAEEAGIDRKYLERSTRDLIREVGGLERAALKIMMNNVGSFTKDLTSSFIKSLMGSYFVVSSYLNRKSKEEQHTKDLGEIIGEGSGSVLGTLGLGATIVSGLASIDKELVPAEFRPYLLGLGALTATTQIASIMYEWYKYEKSKLVEEAQQEIENKSI